VKLNDAKAAVSSFRLETDVASPAVMATLLFPRDESIGAVDDKIVVSLIDGDAERLLFTGAVCAAGATGAYRRLALADGFRKLCSVKAAPAYRKEKARVVLRDLLDAAGVTDTALACPDVELARFSLDERSVARCIRILVKTLEEYGFYGLRWFFDEQDTFHFGTFDDTGKNGDGGVLSFARGKNVYEYWNDFTGSGIAVEALPARHSQAITVDGRDAITLKSDLLVSARASRLSLWYRETS
jgi:hypothetical protein